MARASRGQHALVMGLAMGAGAAIGVAARGLGLAAVLATAIVSAAGGAVIGGTLLHGKIRRETAAVGVLRGPVRRSAGRAALWGRVPENPETRAAAHSLAEHVLSEHRRTRVVGVVSGLFATLLLVVAAVLASPWWWIGAAVVAGLVAYGQFVLPARLRRRVELLRTPAD